MRVPDLTNHMRHLARYNAWANERVFAALAGVPDGERKTWRGGSFGSIQETLLHILGADSLWMSRFAGRAEMTDSEREKLRADFDALRAARTEADRAIIDYAGQLGVEELPKPFRFTIRAAQREMVMPLALCLLQMFNHATYHRGQVAHMMRVAGFAPPATDMLLMPDAEESWI